MKQPLISVIVPIYMVEKYIHRCIDSILQQTYKNLEIILIDDGSPDKCGKICDMYLSVDSRVAVIHQKNGGVGAARNTGLQHCRGEFITFVDGDDYISSDLIETLYSKINDVDYISCGFSRCDNEEKVQYVFAPTEEMVLSGTDALYRHYSGDNARDKINCVYVWGKLYRRKLWEELNFPEKLLFEDICLMPYMQLRCKKVKFISYAGYYYREQQNSITNSTDSDHRKKAFKDSFIIWDNHINFYKERSMDNLVADVECLEVDKIISQSIANTIPEGMEEFAQKILKETVRKVLTESISLQKKVRYVLFLVLGEKGYRVIKRAFRH